MKKIIILFIFIVFTIIIIYNKDEEKEVMKDIKYNKTIEVLLESNNFNIDYLDEYLYIDFYEIKNFPYIVNSLLDKNYKNEEINYIFSNKLNSLDILLNMNYIDILKFKNVKNFDINKVNRYIEYQNKYNYDIEKCVTYVNIGLDKLAYEDYITYKNYESSNISILVNKYHKLSDDYEPKDLEKINGTDYYLRKDAKEAYLKLASAALIDNVIIHPFSAYRSYETQEKLYNAYKETDGVIADTYSARPGFSEHQLGLAVDVRSNTLIDNLTDEDYKWMLNNSYKYGFIVRYPKGKEHITMYKEEPWHIRYLGVDLATKVYNSNLTYDEYYDLYLTEHE